MILKILHVINLQGFGGAERLFIEYIKNSSFDNEILCTSNHLNKNLISELNDFKIIYANKVASTSVKYPTFLRKFVLTKKIEKLKPNKTVIWDFVPRLAKKPKNTDLIYYDHGCSWRYPTNKKTLDFFNMLDSNIAVSNASKRIMELRFNTTHVSVVLNRLPLDIVTKRKSIQNKDIIVLGTASRLVGLKAIGIAIITLKQLLSKGTKAKLIIAGTGEEESNLKELTKKLTLDDHVEFLGYQSDMTYFYSSIDIYLSTPITEPFGLSCIEALSRGIPVVYPVIDGQPEAIKDGGIGINPDMTQDDYSEKTGMKIDFPYDVYDPINDCLTSPKLLDPKKCADAINSIINNYEELSENALQWSKQTTNYKIFISELESALINK